MNSIKHINELTVRILFILLAAALLAVTINPLTAHADEIKDQLAAGSYAEGEAIAAIRTDARKMQAQSNEQFEVTELMSVDPSVIEKASEDDQTQAPPGQPSYSVRDVAPLSDEIDLCVVSSDTLSTEELLRILADDPDVVFAEPNYTFNLDGDHISAGSAPAAKIDAEYSLAENPDADTTGDLTYLQWGNWSNDRTARAPGMASNPSINVPGFGDTGRNGNMDKPVTVALLDTGVYPEHPDLKNVVYHFTPEQQAALGCWEWGYNAVGKGANGNKRDEASIAFGHGTHTAGIIGAEWNGSGTSGVASNVRIVCIQLSDSRGDESLADALAAYAFVNRFNEQAPPDERIMVTSNSWSGYSSSRALDAVLRELGDRWGTVSVFSSGNDGKNNDRYEKTPSSSADNPYVIVVANTTANDRLNESSEFGTKTVDLAAPGTGILSTSTPDRGLYLPDASRDSNILYLGFDGQNEPEITVSQVYPEDESKLNEEDGPKIYEKEKIVRENISAKTDQAHFYGQNCLKIDVDPKYVVHEFSWITESQLYDLQFDIDLRGTDIGSRLDGKKDLMLGAAFASDKDSSSILNSASTNAAFITEGETARQTATYNMIMGGTSDNQWGAAFFPVTSDDFALTDVSAVNPGDTLSIKMRIAIPKGCTTIYIDSIGIGTEKAPYEFATGTSMSCPAVSGAAAVLASQGYKGTELASLVRSKVRIPERGALATKTGGVFDFSAAGSPDSGSSSSSAPAIRDVAVSGSSITVTGSNFGSKQGKAELSRYIVGTDLQTVTADIVSWADDKVTLESGSPLEGILQIVLTNAGGKHDTGMCFAGKGDNVYEQDLPFDASTADTAVYGDGKGDWETRGPLVGLGCKLYYLPAYCGKTDEYPAHKNLRCFDLKTKKWTDLPDLPEWLQDVSAVMYEGKIVVEGETMHIADGEPTGLFPEGESEERVYIYDPESKKWTKASSEGMYPDQTILNDDGQLKLAGGVLPGAAAYLADPAPLMAYDPAKGAGEALCDMPDAFKNPAAAAKDGTILLYSAGPDRAFMRIKDGQAALLEQAVPDFFLAEGDEPEDGAWGPLGRNQYICVLAPASDGFVLVGPPETGGASDTYILRDGSDRFEAYSKRASDDRAYSQAGCTYRGRLFVIASAWFEPETRLFRATAMDVPEYPGDIDCDEQDEQGDDQDDDPGKDTDGNKHGDKVRTGDEAHLELWITLTLLAALTLAALSLMRIRMNTAGNEVNKDEADTR